MQKVHLFSKRVAENLQTVPALFVNSIHARQSSLVLYTTRMSSLSTAACSTPKFNDKKRPRKKNWSQEETKFLLEQYRENVTVLKASFSSGITSRQKQGSWEKIAQKMQEVFPDKLRTVKECQKRWQTVQCAAKVNISRHNQAVRGTGMLCTSLYNQHIGLISTSSSLNYFTYVYIIDCIVC